MVEATEILWAITKWNNVYRSNETSVDDKLEALWDMGDFLYKAGVAHANKLGSKIQEISQGVVKRAMIYRSHKVRSIWHDKSSFLHDCDGIKGVANLQEILPFLDPEKDAYANIPSTILASLKAKMRKLSSDQFRLEVKSIKFHFISARSVNRPDKAKHLFKCNRLQSDFKKVKNILETALLSNDKERLKRIREATSRGEFISVSNMALALTSKDNYQLYNGLKPANSSSSWNEFKAIYDEFKILLTTSNETERNKVRQLIVPTELALFSDLARSITSETGVRDYLKRRTLDFAVT